MIIPVRCFSCGKIIGDLYQQYKKDLEKGLSPKDSFNNLGLDRYCCRRMILTHVDFLEEINSF